jgi:hypothetical protein
LLSSLFLSGFAGFYFNSSEFQVHRDSTKSRSVQGLEEICRGDYYKIYIPARDRLKEKQGEDPEIISSTPRVEKIRGLDAAGDDSFYLIEGDHVKKKIYCTIKRRDYQQPSCKALSVFFRDRIRFHFTFSRAPGLSHTQMS